MKLPLSRGKKVVRPINLIELKFEELVLKPIPEKITIFALPRDVLRLILEYLDGKDIRSWMLTCKTFRNSCNEEIMFKSKCFQLWPYLFILQLNPLFSTESPLTWKQKFILVRNYPHRLVEPEEQMKGEVYDGVFHQNKTGGNTNIVSTTILPSTLPAETIIRLLQVSHEIPSLIQRQGVEYIEMYVKKNTLVFNRYSNFLMSLLFFLKFLIFLTN